MTLPGKQILWAQPEKYGVFKKPLDLTIIGVKATLMLSAVSLSDYLTQLPDSITWSHTIFPKASDFTVMKSSAFCTLLKSLLKGTVILIFQGYILYLAWHCNYWYLREIIIRYIHSRALQLVLLYKQIWINKTCI